MRWVLVRAAAFASVALPCLVAAPLSAQARGGLHGRVTDAVGGAPLTGVSVVVAGARAALTDSEGRYRLRDLEAGQQRVMFRLLGVLPVIETVTITAGSDVTLDVSMPRRPIPLGEVVVTGASKVPERIVEAPAAVVVPDAARVQESAQLGQAAFLVGDLPGVRLAQGGLYDFDVNARGFNTPTNRRLLVLVDGRDISSPILGNQDWATISVLDDAAHVELVKGPGAALYGANAFNGVLAITTPSVREEIGTRLRLTGGELMTMGGDVRHGWLAADGRWGIRASAGYQQGDTFDRARTNNGDLTNEYFAAGISPAGVNAPAPGYELRPLNGQSKATPFGFPGGAIGSADPVRNYFAALRADLYRADGSVITVEGGSAEAENTVTVQAAGRSQGLSSTQPWARAAWTSDRFSIFGYYNGREGHSHDLSSGTEGIDRTASMHLEAQGNRFFAGARGRVVMGASAREVRVDTRGSILSPEQDGRRDHLYAVFGQVDYQLATALKAVVAARLDDGDLDAAQVSPKLGIVYTPAREQSLRVTWNRGLLAASPLQRFIRFAAGPPLDLTAFEAGLRASPLGPALAGVPVGQLFDNSAAVPVLALGNQSMRPELVEGLELGYKGQRGPLFLTVDAWYSKLSQFGTTLLPGVNATFRGWTAPAAVPGAAQAPLEAAVAGALGLGLTRDRNGISSYVLSVGNGGDAREYGAEISAGYAFSDRLHVDANYSYYAFAIDQGTFQPGDTILANTPPHTANLALAYGRVAERRVRIGLRWEDAYAFRAGRWNGALPSALSLDLNASAPLTPTLTWALSATNLLDQQRIHVYGGSVVGRRMLATLTWRP